MAEKMQENSGGGWNNFLKLALLKPGSITETQSANVLCGAKTFVGVLFSETESEVCTSFNKDCASWYAGVKNSGEFEMVFVSSDRTQEAFQKGRSSLPCPALPLEARGVAESLARSFDVDKIPRLVVIDGATGTVKVPNGRGHIAVAKEKNLHPMEVINVWRRGPTKKEAPEAKKLRQKDELKRSMIGISFGLAMLLARHMGFSIDFGNPIMEAGITIAIVLFVRHWIWAGCAGQEDKAWWRPKMFD